MKCFCLDHAFRSPSPSSSSLESPDQVARHLVREILTDPNAQTDLAQQMTTCMQQVRERERERPVAEERAKASSK